MNLLLGALLLLMVLSPPGARAESYASPLLCGTEEATLKVQNLTDQPQDFWFQAVGSTPFQERFVTVKARGLLNLPLNEYYNSQESALAIKTHGPGLQFKLFCRTTSLTWELAVQDSPWKRLSLSGHEKSLELHLVNLSQQENTILLNFEPPTRPPLQWTLPAAFSDVRVRVAIPRGARGLAVHAEGRWAGQALNSAGSLLAFEEQKRRTLPAPPHARYFLFESLDPANKDSFVVPMTDSRLIQESLQQLQNPPLARLLVARIEKSLRGWNRDFSSPLQTPWSWQVIEAQNYADLAHISCDGTPRLVEERLNAWLVETGGTLCFWGYRISRELNASELSGSTPSSWPLGPGSLPRTR